MQYIRHMKIKRILESRILEHFKTSTKGVVIYGPRQAGKTTLVNDILQQKKWKTLTLNGDKQGDWQQMLTSRNSNTLGLLIGGYDALFVDEAQRIPEIGINLKIIRDEFPQLRVVVTGSSALDLASKISEPLTGRVYGYHLYPIAQAELLGELTRFEVESTLEERLVYGSYPEVFSLAGHQAKVGYLRNLTDAYLYKDILEFGDIRNSAKIRDLLKLLAFQIGSQVSLTELASSLELSRNTVDRYIDLLEKSFVIFRLSGFSRNLRKEVTKMDKIYFYDIGVRNALIDNFNLLANREDVGGLWENFLIVERMKRQEYKRGFNSQYFWRLSTGAELDLVEEENGDLTGFEFKYGKKLAKAPESWQSAYPKAGFKAVYRENYLDFVGLCAVSTRRVV